MKTIREKIIEIINNHKSTEVKAIEIEILFIDELKKEIEKDRDNVLKIINKTFSKSE
jgi:hemerythrin-like domain-containing protein